MSLTVNTNVLPQNNWNNNQTKLSTATNTTVASVPADAVIDTVNVSSAVLDTYINTFTSTVTSLQSSVENVSSIHSRIRENGVAQQSAVQLKTQFTEQPHLAMLAQANLSPQSVSALLR